MITTDNYFLSTQGSWKPCKKPKKKPSFTSYKRTYTYFFKDEIKPFFKHSFVDYEGYKRFYYEDKKLGISSRYWYGQDKKGNYIIRESDHWGKVASCYWSKKFNTLNDYRKTITAKIYLKNLESL